MGIHDEIVKTLFGSNKRSNGGEGATVPQMTRTQAAST